MKQIPTAEEFVKKNITSSDKFDFNNKVNLIKNFAKLHVEAQNEAILENVRIEYYLNGQDEFGEDIYAERIKENSITEAYPLSNIK